MSKQALIKKSILIICIYVTQKILLDSYVKALLPEYYTKNLKPKFELNQ